MPWRIEQNNNEYCVIQEASNETVSCHATEEEAIEQMRALYVNEKIVKAISDFEIEVRGVPFGNLNNKDSDNEYFDEASNLHDDKFPTPPAVYYHGYGPDGKPLGRPEYIGKTIAIEKRPDGVWYRIVLDKTKELARRVWDAARRGLARASSGSIPHLVRISGSGHVDEWPVAELSLFDIGEGRQPANVYAVALPVLKSTYQQAGLTLPDLDGDPEGAEAERRAGLQKGNNYRKKDKVTKMSDPIELSEKELQVRLDEARKEGVAQKEAEIKVAEERATELKAAEAKGAADAEAKFAEEKTKLEEAAKVSRRLPGAVTEGVNQAAFNDLWKYDHLTPEDLAVMVGVQTSAKNDPKSQLFGKGASENARKALAIRMIENKESLGQYTRGYMMKANIATKADEIMQQDLATAGDEWVGVAYSQALWNAIRVGTFVAAKIPSIEVPPGHESVVIPTEDGDPTFYKVAEATAEASSVITKTVTSSKFTTGKATLSLAKMGARVMFSGELDEDSLIPVAPELRRQLEVAGLEALETAIIDGDTAAGASANINDIAGTPASTDLFLLFNGFRKSPLVTTTANSRSGSALTAEDYLETVKLLGTAGMEAADIAKVSFIVDPNVYWKSLELAPVKTRDVFVAPTIEQGRLAGIYGYSLFPSWNMHKSSTVRKANTAGKVDVDTTANNTTGSILAVRWDAWRLGFRRRMTIESTRVPSADVTEIVALMRLGLIQRSTEASAITYNLTV